MNPENSSATFTEIHNQAHSSQETVERAPARLNLVRSLLPLNQYTDIILTGCGSSHHLAVCASFAWSRLLGRRVAAVPSSELMNSADYYLAKDARPLVIAISRSGSTTEVKLAVERLTREREARSLAITGETGGAVAEVCDKEIAFVECLERSVVMTQAFTCMLTGLYLLADGATGSRYADEIGRIPELISGALDKSEQILKAIAADKSIDKFFFLGSGAMKGTADECALKMTEMALVWAAGHRSLEFRHGPKAALDSASQVVIFPTAAERPHIKTLLEEIRSAGAHALLIDEETESAAAGHHQRLVIGGNISEIFRPALYAHTGQLLAYWRATLYGMNPDAPPNLSRAVLLDSDSVG